MPESNPLVLAQTLRSTLERYLQTTLQISRNYPELRAEHQRLTNEHTLVRGPFVEALPDFEKKGTLRGMLRSSGGPLHDGLGALPATILDRPLHKHQADALLYASEQNQSLLVATGTGSGKTECFLYPIAHRLLDDPEPTRPGVRCLIIYPMNALANDQLFYRIAPLFGRYLAGFGITFGRFTSQIQANRSRPDEEDAARENHRLMAALGSRNIPKNWMLTREEMLVNPPKILITNYAMLEHLLLLPRNAPLFAQNMLQCVVLDEIHTYTGAQATEVAYLLRKLKNRLNLQKPLQVFGTSASFPHGEEADKEIARFAADLFGEVVHRVLRGKRVPHQNLSGVHENRFSLTCSQWIRLGQVLRELEQSESPNVAAWKELVSGDTLRDCLPDLDNAPLESELERAFSRNDQVRCVSAELHRTLIQDFCELAERVFPNQDKRAQSEALDAVLRLGMIARSAPESFPLLPGRYHLAVNCPDGVSVKLDSNRAEGWGKLYPLRRYQDGLIPYYSLLVCRKCGQPFFEGYEHAGMLHPRQPALVSGKSHRRLFWLGSQTAQHADDEADSNEAETDDVGELPILLDPDTGRIGAANGIKLYPVACRVDEVERVAYLRICPACGGRASGTDAEIVTPMHPGNEAVCAVVAQKVIEALPANNSSNTHSLPWGGRKLLTFSDNRQTAAFFAPYFERTSFELALRTALCRVVRDSNTVCDLDLLTFEVFQYWKQSGEALLIDQDGNQLREWEKIRYLLMGKVAAEFCTPGGRRNSLEALGAVRVTYDDSPLDALCEYTAKTLPLDAESASALVHFLLETMRREKALGHLGKVDMRLAWIWGKVYSGHRSFGLHPGGEWSHNWLPQEGTKRKNRRISYLLRVPGIGDTLARNFLVGFWELMQDTGMRVSLKPGSGLDARLLRFKNGAQSPLNVCTSCGLMQNDVVHNICSAFGCTGYTRLFTEAEREDLWRKNHYLHSYREGHGRLARAHEHTASLSTGLRDQVEREFGSGNINLLSCTTTMELGVDLGELEAIVNLNLPPGISNYQQRTGRAGRRAQAAPFSVTVARNAPYDQAVYAHFDEYLRRPSAVPFVRLDNAQLFRRHQNAIVLSHFLRHVLTNLDRNAPTLQDLFGEKFGDKQRQEFSDARDSWLESAAGKSALDEAEALGKRLPQSLSAVIGLSGGPLLHYFRGRLDMLADEVCDRWKIYTNELNKIEGDDGASYRRRNHWAHMREAYLKQFLVDLLSRKGIIPSYSFPVHSLSLEVITEAKADFGWQNQSDIMLNRDASLGISEYAPGAEVVANGRIWTSRGLAYSSRIFMPTEWYVACPTCHHVDLDVRKDNVPRECTNCGAKEKRIPRSFLVPRGFVTSYDERIGADPGLTRRRERPADEARLLTIPREDQFSACDHDSVWTTLLRAQADEQELCGSLFIVNRGPHGFGYKICPLCRAAESAKEPKPVKWAHKDPLTGKACCYDSYIYTTDLVHSFDTDVLILRIAYPLPNPGPDDGEPQIFRETCARTLAEALRFAAAEELSIQASELRGSYRMRNSAVDVILYDAVAGGAGYCARLNETSMSTLLNTARKRLQCPQDCATACTACLCDYSNQRAWDQFLRKPVHLWLRHLNAHSLPSPLSKYGALLWVHPSLTGLQQNIAELPEFHIFAPRLDDGLGSVTADEGILKCLLSSLNAGQRIHLHTSQDLTTSAANMTSSLRRALCHFEPWLLDERLRIGRLKSLDEKTIVDYPRIFSTQPNGPAWYTLNPLTPLFESLIPKPVFRATNQAAALEMIQQLVSRTQWYSVADLKPTLPIERFAFQPGAKRNLGVIFAVLTKGHLEKMVVHDPFCAVNHSPLRSLLEFVKGTVSTFECVEVHCRELHSQDKNYEAMPELQVRMENLLQGFAAKLYVSVASFRQRRQFHDRWIEFKLIAKDGTSSVQHFDLSGGIDYLMDPTAATTIYRYGADPH
jgi:hypothetical protein